MRNEDIKLANEVIRDIRTLINEKEKELLTNGGSAEYQFGDTVNSKEYDVVDGVIIGIERTSSNSGYDDKHHDIESYLDSLDTFRYLVAYTLDEKVYKDTFYDWAFD